MDARIGDEAAAAASAKALADFAPAVWRAALERVPRHRFIPSRAGAGTSGWIDRDTYPAAWWAAVAADDAIVTQVDDGMVELTAETMLRSMNPTSSCSAPSLVFHCLELLEPRDGDRVLEIGTGTGWTAGLLSAFLGEENVTSIEVDPAVAGVAAANLKSAGLSPRLVTGDGVAGFAGGGPYDGVHVTCGVRQIPAAWIEQTRLGGTIVAPYMADFGTGAIVHLDVLGDGTATGAFTKGAGYMLLRSQRRPLLMRPWESDDDGQISRMRFDPRAVTSLRGGGAGLVLSARLPGVEAVQWVPEPDGLVVCWLIDGASGSWASADYHSGDGTFEVEQYGPRRLWDEAESAYLDWLRWGRPGLDRLGLTVSANGTHRVWLDFPGNEIS